MSLNTPSHSRAKFTECDTVSALFAAQAERRSEAIAVSCRGETLTYGELAVRANQLAWYLRRHGVGPEVRVGVCVERSPAMVVALLGIVQAGGAYVPLDPGYPAARLRFMLTDAGVSVLVTETALTGTLGSYDGVVVCLDRDAEIISRERAGPVPESAGPDNLAYVIYTSGSTGMPKGVAVAHRSILELFRATYQAADHREDDIWSLAHSYSFDFSVWEIWGSFLHGSKLVIVPAGLAQSPEALWDILRRERVTVLSQTPSALRGLVSYAQGGMSFSQLALRLVISGGEALPGPLAAAILEAGVPIWNYYGPTEATVWSTIHRASTADSRSSFVPIGYPLPKTEVFVLDRDLTPVPVGVVGELYIGGAGLARGYLGRPALTAERFIPHPYSTRPGARLYRTGDLVRYRPDGNLEFLGRGDHQVKVRGFRIELGEIEAALAKHPAVGACVVVAREDTPGEKQLVAYVVTGGAPEAEPRELREYLQERLPSYMVPTAFVQLAALPVTSNGKLDRRALPAPLRDRDLVGDEYVAPRTSVETVLAGIWAEVLGLERVGVHDNFFELGGDSVQVVRVVSEAIRAGIFLTASEFFQLSTIAGLAAGRSGEDLVEVAASGLHRSGYTGPGVPSLIDRGIGDETWEALLRQAGTWEVGPGEIRREIEAIYPLSHMQQGMLFHNLLSPDLREYFQQVVCMLEGPILEDMFVKTWEALLQRHVTLRSAFFWQGLQAPVRAVFRSPGLVWETWDWRDRSRTEQVRKFEALLRSDREQALELHRAPVMRHYLIRVGEQSYRFLWSHHHLLLDGWSLATVLRELFAEYACGVRGSHFHPPAARPYSDYVRWELEQNRREAEQFWRHRLQGFQAPTRLPVEDGVNAVIDSYSAYAEVDLELSPETSTTLKQIARRNRVTLSTLVQAAWALLLSHYIGADDVMFGLTVSGRAAPLAGIDGMVGTLINTIPMRAQVNASMRLGPWLQELHAQEADLLAYEHTSLTDIQGWSEIPRGSPLFDTILVFENHPWPEDDWEAAPELRVRCLQVLERTSYPLTLTVTPGRQLRLRLGYQRVRFSEASIHRLMGHLSRLLEGFASDPGSLLRDLWMLAVIDKGQLLREWNTASRPYLVEQTVGDLFCVQVKRTPYAIAVSMGGVTVTYQEVDARSNQLAAYLRRFGVGPESQVAVCVDRSPTMVIATLAVLKAGAAYVPLDPTYPTERLRLMLKDCGPVVLTESAHIDVLEGWDGRLVVLDKDAEFISQESPALIPCPARSDNLAYVIYTSGSTGKAKGVMVTHRSLANAYFAWEEEYGLRTTCRNHLQMAAFSFDVCSGDLLRALCSGGKLVICPRDLLLAPADLYSLMLREAIDCAEFTPIVLRGLARYLEATGERLDFMRVLAAGSDTWSDTEYTALQQLCGADTRIINSYGLTEATIDSTYFQRATTHAPSAGAVPIGRPFPNTDVYVLDKDLTPVPVGVVGELYIGGAGLARGYLGRPALTAERFIPHPYSTRPGARLYRTGDLVRYRPDGNLEFLGRGDHQVKVRGFRIELGEIEAALAKHPAVGACVVVAREDTPGEKQLVAYVVTGGAPEAEPRELREYLQERLPSYMVPTAFVQLAALPVTSNGKLDRRALPAPLRDRDLVGDEYVAPRTSVETVLAGIWAEVLGLERVGVHDNFFELGGHSLLATQVISAAREALEIDLPLRVMFDRPTVEDMAILALGSPADRRRVERTAELFLELLETPEEAIEAEWIRLRPEEKES
ncbi:MAG: amino acid adenylation domain-containing protein [Zoogloeaceae bacterium]|nr:amino acid adenylation domain-containing protein [Zoogloeaceae bacterium]